MSDQTAAAPGLPPQLRVSAYYLTGFMTMGVFTAFGGIWLSHQGIGEDRIGLINAAPLMLLILLNLWVGRIADRASDWRRAIVLLVTLAAVGPIGLAVFGTGFWLVLLFWSLTSVAQGLAVPVTDAAAIRLARRTGFDYSAVRAFGTLGYVGAIFATGAVVSHFGAVAFLPILIASVVLRAAAAQLLPRFRAPQGTTATLGAKQLREVLKPWFVLPLVGWAMCFGTFLVLNGFQALLWSKQGIPDGWITFLIALGAMAETAMFFGFRSFSSRFSARHLILASALITIFRWICFAFSPGIAVLIPLQLLHSVTYAMGFMGCVAFIANWTSEDIAAEAQSFFVLLQQIFATVALSGFGWLAARYGAHAYFASAVFAGIDAVLIWLSLRLKETAASSASDPDPGA